MKKSVLHHCDTTRPKIEDAKIQRIIYNTKYLIEI